MREKHNIKNIEDALSRLRWRFTQGKAFVPNQNDADALNFMMEWVGKAKEDVLREQQLFAKLYANLMRIELAHYGDIHFAQRSVNDICKQPLAWHYEKFHMAFNGKLLEQFLSANSIEHTPKFFRSDEEQKQIEEELRQNPEYRKFAGGYWEYEKTEKALLNQTSEAINAYKNLP